MARVHELPTGSAIDLDQLFAVGPVGGHSWWDVSFALTFLAWTGPVRSPQEYRVHIDDHLAYRDRAHDFLQREGESDAEAAERRLVAIREYAERVRSELIAAWRSETPSQPDADTHLPGEEE